jgi:putative transposase
MQALHSNGNAVFRIVYHLVLVTKYRRKVLTGPMIDRAHAVLSGLVMAQRGSVLECAGEADHLHALLDLPPTVRPSDLVNSLKTVTSRRLRTEFAALRAAYRKPVLWSPSYCLISAGGAPIEVLRRYIEAQDTPA